MNLKYKRVKTPTVIQMETVECGAASLAMILSYYKKYIPLEKLRIECGVSRDGVKAGNIARAAERLGLSVKAFRKEPEQLVDIKPPMIIHWNFNHFVVFEGFRRGKAYINDPAHGHTVLTMSEFDKAFTGVVLTFEPKKDFLPDGEKPSVISSLKKRLTGIKSSVPFMTFVGLLLVIPSLIIPSFAKIFIDDILTNEHSEYLNGLLAAMALTMLLQAFLMFIQKKYLLLVKNKLTVTETSRFFVHILKLPIVFFQQRSAGDLNSRMNSNNTITAFLTDKLAENFINILMIIFYIAAMISFSPTLTIISIILVAVNVVYFVYSSERVKEASNKSLNDSGKLYSTAVSGINIIETIKATGSENDFFAKWSGYHAKVLNNSQIIGKKRQYLFSIPNFISALANVFMITVGSVQIINGTGDMSVGTLIAFQSLFASFTAPVTSITQMGMEIRDFQADMNRIDDVIKYETDSDFGNFEYIENNTSTDFIQGNVEVKEISFGYNVLEPPLIENFSMNLSSGQRVALIGGSGSGKSTVLKIIAGLHKQWKGKVMFDGIENSELSPQTFSRFITMVNQDINIFEGTIYDNITMWDDSIPESDVIQAAKDAEIYDDISKRPNGFKEVMTDGGRNFSGGQCQRIEIARALAVNPSILLMDEATSALDTTTEKRVFDNIRRRGCTCIIVAHRLSTIRDCDEIIVMHKGCILQRGTHNEMKNQDGIYSQLILADS